MFLGDYVGYGADPGFAVDTVKEFVARGAIALIGNHDSAAIGAPGAHERRGDAWRSNGRVSNSIRASSRSCDALPLTAAGRRPSLCARQRRLAGRWEYVFDERAAARSLHATDADRTFCGHTHVPALFQLTATGKVAAFEPMDDVAMPLTWHRRWVAVIGAVGQPRDGNPAACYALFDDVTRELTYVRVPYDIAGAQRKIRDAGLPPFLSARLARGM